MLTLCTPKPPPLSQKCLYGAPGGASGTGKDDNILGLAGSATSIMEKCMGACGPGSSQPPVVSELVTTIFRLGKGVTEWTEKSIWYSRSTGNWLTSLGLRGSLMSRITSLL